MPRKLGIHILPVRDWPSRDRAAWTLALRSGSILDDGGKLARYPKRQKDRFKSAYGRWLGFLAEFCPEVQVESGVDHFARETLSNFVDRISATLAPFTVRAYLTDLLTVARAIGPDHDFKALWAATRHIWRTARPAKEKRSLLVPSRDLYKLGFDLVGSALNEVDLLDAAGTFRDGIMIALLAARPVRLSNLTSIEIDLHLERPGEQYWLMFPAHEVKNRRPLEFPLPHALTVSMDRYLTHHRPLLVSAGRQQSDTEPFNALWVSSRGSRLKGRKIWEIIRQRTYERFGHPINPHLFRDAAATSIAIEDPGHVGIITAILGHSSYRTAECYYNQATSLEAARRLQDVIGAYRS